MFFSLGLPRPRKAAALLALLGLGASTACAADDLASRPYLFGDWGGTRTRLADDGIDFSFGYQNEAGHNYRGGDRRLTRMTDQWKAGVTLDLDKLWGWHDTVFTLLYTNRNGRNLDTDSRLGNLQQTQELYGRGQTTWLTKLTVEKGFFDHRLAIKAGRESEGDDFGYANCDFQNLSLCGSEEGNVFGRYWMNWPVSVWMVRGKWATSAHTYVQLGVYQQNPTYIDNAWMRRSAWKINNPGGTQGVVVPLEFGWTPTFGGYDGSYKFGVVYNSGGLPDLIEDANGQPRAITGLPGRQRDGAYSGYIAFLQQVSGINGGKGLTVGLRATAGDRQTSPVDRQFSLNLEYHGPFARSGDIIGLGFAATHASSRQADYQRLYNAYHPDDAGLVADSYEYVSELFYSWQPIRSVTLQPNLQYILHPGGTSENKNALVLGLKTVVAF
ncbi:carbohydrate porin [Frateuria defendens]|uniref:carbohydrate porin n=1 Tax=Frateuria defendens TaxID=2219559 RepID=UPI00066FD82D|nr:carbohydrate porin [Frateuria defendens]